MSEVELLLMRCTQGFILLKKKIIQVTQGQNPDINIANFMIFTWTFRTDVEWNTWF